MRHQRVTVDFHMINVIKFHRLRVFLFNLSFSQLLECRAAAVIQCSCFGLHVCVLCSLLLYLFCVRQHNGVFAVQKPALFVVVATLYCHQREQQAKFPSILFLKRMLPSFLYFAAFPSLPHYAFWVCLSRISLSLFFFSLLSDRFNFFICQEKKNDSFTGHPCFLPLLMVMLLWGSFNRVFVQNVMLFVVAEVRSSLKDNFLILCEFSSRFVGKFNFYKFFLHPFLLFPLHFPALQQLKRL